MRDKLRCKEIWVLGANRYRNPDEDLPADFEKYREENYKALNQPFEADVFINELKMVMKSAEVAAMIEGLLRHCEKIKLDMNERLMIEGVPNETGDSFLW
ncbi:MAG: hypothetical protein A4E55_02004 [Pelotomaculum sp. PtaU1.Bin035]|nr:MAG: hypothetical protein A4E55_02004 [Pelotomaculum sp. PtaU1.Bin035]